MQQNRPEASKLITASDNAALASTMKRKLMDILACPVCKHHPLELTVKKEDEKEVLEGTIRCPKCAIDYPIEDGIPNMLPPEK
jgi:uncharacterized protein YbaR (Trm112 family)